MKTSIGNIVGRIGNSFLAVLFASLAGGAFAGTVVTWTGNGGDDLWSNSENWDPQTVPTYKEDVHIPSGNWRIIHGSGEQWYGTLCLDDGSGTVTLEGSRTTFKPASTGDLQIGAGRELVVSEGMTLMLKYDVPFANGVLRVRSGGSAFFNNNNAANCTIGGAARVFVEGGTFLNNKCQLFITNNAEVVVSEGLMCAKWYRAYGPDAPGEEGALLRVTGGTLWNDYIYACFSRIYPGARFENRGGTVLWGTSPSSDSGDQQYDKLSSGGGNYASGDFGFSSFLPPQGGCLNLLTYDDCTFGGSGGDNGALYFAVTGDYDFGGDIFATNITPATVTSPGFVCVDGGRTVRLTGGGRIFANGFLLRDSVKLYLDVSAVYLGSGGFNQAGSSCETYFLNDIVLGAWGDWSAVRGSNGRFTFAGDLTFDTLNCFDKTTTHTITMKAGFVDVTSLKAVGGGTVALFPNIYGNAHPAWPVLLRSLTVGDSTSLFVTNSTEAIRTSALTLGSGSTLTFDLAENRCIDVLGKLEVGSNARIVAKLPASLTANKLYPVFFAPAGVAVPDGLVEIDGTIPSGWTLVKRANLVYLSDGEVAYVDTWSQYFKHWSGAVDGDFATVGNWADDESPEDSASPTNWYRFAVFGGTKRMDVNVANPVRTYGISMAAGAGPFIFTGDKITVYSPADSTTHRNGVGNTQKYGGGVVSNSDLPWVINNDVVYSYSSARDAYFAVSYNLGSISMLGDNPKRKDVSEFYFGGDVRIGGDWTVSLFNVCTNSYLASAKRAHTLTLLPGASLSVTDQDDDFDRSQQFLLAQGSALTVGGSTCRFLMANTHFIDGTLTLAGALDASAKQTFLGDGTNKFQSATGELDFKGAMTLVPGSLVDNVSIYLKGEPTIAPAADWTYGGDASISLEDHSSLTLATGGHKLTLEKPIVSEGDMAVTGGGRVEIAAAGMSLGKITCSDGATFAVSDAIAGDRFVDVLTVREDDESIAFGREFKVKKRVDEETGRTVYSAKCVQGMLLIYR